MVNATLQNSIRIIAIVFLFIIGLNALAAGYSFIVEPSGKRLGMTTNYLQYSPFRNYFIPGIILFTAIGIFSILTAIMAIKRKSIYPLLLFIEGCLLLGWIVIQVLMVKDINWMHITCFCIGIVLIFSGILIVPKQNIQYFKKYFS